MCRYAKCLYAVVIFMLVIMLSVFMQSVIMMRVTKLSVIMLSVIAMNGLEKKNENNSLAEIFFTILSPCLEKVNVHSSTEASGSDVMKHFTPAIYQFS
jgi:hypothetical protein